LTALISHTTFDSIDAYAQSVFWGQVLGVHQDPDDPNVAEEQESMIFSADGTQRLFFNEVPNVKKRSFDPESPLEASEYAGPPKLLRRQ